MLTSYVLINAEAQAIASSHSDNGAAYAVAISQADASVAVCNAQAQFPEVTFLPSKLRSLRF